MTSEDFKALAAVVKPIAVSHPNLKGVVRNAMVALRVLEGDPRNEVKFSVLHACMNNLRGGLESTLDYDAVREVDSAIEQNLFGGIGDPPTDPGELDFVRKLNHVKLQGSKANDHLPDPSERTGGLEFVWIRVAKDQKRREELIAFVAEGPEKGKICFFTTQPDPAKFKAGEFCQVCVDRREKKNLWVSSDRRSYPTLAEAKKADCPTNEYMVGLWSRKYGEDTRADPREWLIFQRHKVRCPECAARWAVLTGTGAP